MRERKEFGLEHAMYTNLQGVQAFTGLGRNLALEVCEKAGAKRKVGKRTIYNLKAIERYLEENA